MPTYVPAFVTESYDFAANPPVLDKVVFTIDHIHLGGPGVYSTADIVRHLVSKNIPVTIFVQCTDPANLCAVDERNVREVINIDPFLVSLGVHSLPRGTSQTDQTNNLNAISNMINRVTGVRPIISSYHGSNAGPETGITFSGIQFARGVSSNWSTAQLDNRLDTPVMGLNSVNNAFNFTRLRNVADLSACLFVHSLELTSGSNRKQVFDTFVKAVEDRKLQAWSYLDAMRSDFGIITPEPIPEPEPEPNPDPTIPTDPADCALKHFTNNRIVQFLRINSRDGVNGNFQVSELQNFLNEIGLNAGSADGIFGPNTKLAVIAYQINAGLIPDGIVGRNSRASINAHCD